QPNCSLLHCCRHGKSSISVTADDYAFLDWGLTELYEATFKPDYLQKSHALMQAFLTSHWDAQEGGFFFTSEESEELLGRKKEFFDSALPSANSVAAMNLLRLGRMTAQPETEQKTDAIARQAASLVEKAPASFTQLLQATLWTHGPTREIVIAGNKEDKNTQELLAVLQ